MKVSDVLFVAGNVTRLASIKIRCREIAQRLGIRCHYQAATADEIPTGYKAYFCVKPDFGPAGVASLAKKGLVIWDVLDDDPPRCGVEVYLTSTSAAQSMFLDYGRTVVIPHYHCNIERITSSGRSRTPGYIGSRHWYPNIDTINHDTHFVDRWTREQVAEVYRTIGISINLRSQETDLSRFMDDKLDSKPVFSRHLRLNSGIKLINSIGFGLPSVSAHEPAYFEIAPNCTIFCEKENFAESVMRLQQDNELYQSMRSRCLDLAETYHVETIAKKYLELIAGL